VADVRAAQVPKHAGVGGVGGIGARGRGGRKYGNGRRALRQQARQQVQREVVGPAAQKHNGTLGRSGGSGRGGRNQNGQER